MQSNIKPYSGDGSYPGSYYAESSNLAPKRPSLQGSVDTDVCIVGAGYSGLSTGLHLAEKGYKVTIVEGARVGWGASGRNGGQVVNGSSCKFSGFESTLFVRRASSGVL